MMIEYTRLLNLIVAGTHLGMSPVMIINRLSQESLVRNRMSSELGVNGGELDGLLRKAGYDLFSMQLTPKSASRHYIALARKIFQPGSGGRHHG